MTKKDSPRGSAVVVTGRTVAVVRIWGARRVVRGPLRGKGGRPPRSRRAVRRELGRGSKHEREVRMRGVEVGGQASRRSKVRVVPVHLQHHHLNPSLSNC